MSCCAPGPRPRRRSSWPASCGHGCRASRSRRPGPSSAGGTGLALVADVRDDAACRRALGEVEAGWGAVDVLVNNVGIGGPPAHVADLSDVDWQRVLDVNTGSVLRMCRLVLPSMPAGGS